MSVTPQKQTFDPALYAASLAYYGLPADYCRVFTTRHLVDPQTKQPRFNEGGDPVTLLVACTAQGASARGQAVWIQVNRPYGDAARTDNGRPKKARNMDIQFLAD